MHPIIYQNAFAGRLAQTPQRIISLVPSITEFLFHLGLETEVVGITKFCTRPEAQLAVKEKVGGTKNINPGKIISLKPDLVLANLEENVKDQIEVLQQFCPVYVSDVASFDDAIEMMQQLGILLDRVSAAAAIIEQVLRGFKSLPATQPRAVRKKACYLIWRKPYMTVGGDTYISDMLERCGFDNVFMDEKRYPEITLDRLRMENCDLVMLSSEPFPFNNSHLEELQQQLPATRFMLVDGEMFSWYGSRLLYVPEYFRSLHQALSLPG